MRNLVVFAFLLAVATGETRLFFIHSPLRYAYDALEPHIDARTMEIHFLKHHNAYTNKFNHALNELYDLGFQNITSLSYLEILTSLDKIPESHRQAIRNQGGGFYNHELFWKMLSPKGGGEPKGKLLSAINEKFGSFKQFQEEFQKLSIGVFGSGWTWLFCKGSELILSTTQNQESPIMQDPLNKILLGLDVWEHAYYLKYQNKRPDYITAWWNVVNWNFVEENYVECEAHKHLKDDL